MRNSFHPRAERLRLSLAVAAVIFTAPALGAASQGLDQTETCQWPTAVGFTQTRCSGVLVHPEIVVSAASCLLPFEMPYGETLAGGSGRCDPRSTGIPCSDVGGCKRHPLYDAETGAWDVQYCWVLTPAPEIAPTPIAMGCELDALEAGADVMLAGFGGSAGSAGKKEAGPARVAAAPGVDTVEIGGDGAGHCSQNDRGGPAFVRMGDGSWRTAAVFSQAATCGEAATYMLLSEAVPWIEEATGVDVTPCHDADGTWRPGPQCTGFATAPEALGGSWDDWCGGDRSGPSETCGPAYVQDDTPPTITILSPDDGAVFDSVPATIDFDVEAQDEGAGIHSIWLELNDEPVAGPVGEQRHTFTLELEEGGYSVAAVAEDVSGNRAQFVIGIAVGDASPPSADSGSGGGPSDGGGASTSGADDAGLGLGGDSQSCGCRGSRAIPRGLVMLLILVCGASRARTASRRTGRSAP